VSAAGPVEGSAAGLTEVSAAGPVEGSAAGLTEGSAAGMVEAPAVVNRHDAVPTDGAGTDGPADRGSLT